MFTSPRPTWTHLDRMRQLCPRSSTTEHSGIVGWMYQKKHAECAWNRSGVQWCHIRVRLTHVNYSFCLWVLDGFGI